METNEAGKFSYEVYKERSIVTRYWGAFLTVVIGLVCINVIFFSKTYHGNTVNAEQAGQVGDFVGGYVGTIFALISILLLYLNLRDQRKSSAIEIFETKYFELLKLHRDNVSEINIGDEKGRKIFVILIRELREILKISKEVSNLEGIVVAQKDLLIASYYALFFGVGPNSTRMLNESLEKYDPKFRKAFIKKLDDTNTKNSVKKYRKFKFTPFEGHQSRLGHYYRHLYQSICYVDAKRLDIDKYEYVKTIRAQLTNHEQALLFINSLTDMGKTWNKKGLLFRYKLVKNIPPNFFDKINEVDITTYFPNGYFEFQDNVAIPKVNKGLT